MALLGFEGSPEEEARRRMGLTPYGLEKSAPPTPTPTAPESPYGMRPPPIPKFTQVGPQPTAPYLTGRRGLLWQIQDSIKAEDYRKALEGWQKLKSQRTTEEEEYGQKYQSWKDEQDAIDREAKRKAEGIELKLKEKQLNAPTPSPDIRIDDETYKYYTKPVTEGGLGMNPAAARKKLTEDVRTPEKPEKPTIAGYQNGQPMMFKNGQLVPVPVAGQPPSRTMLAPTPPAPLPATTPALPEGVPLPPGMAGGPRPGEKRGLPPTAVQAPAQAPTTSLPPMQPVWSSTGRGSDEADIEEAAQALASPNPEDLSLVQDVLGRGGQDRIKVFRRAREIAASRGDHFSYAQIRRKVNTMEYYTPSKKGGQQLQSFDTFLQHDWAAYQVAQKYNAQLAPYLQKTVNELKEKFQGDPLIMDLLVALEPVGTEFYKFLLNQGAIYQDDRDMINIMNDPSHTLEQQLTALKRMAHTADARLKSINHGYKRVVGADIDFPFSAEGEEAAAQLGVDLHPYTAPGAQGGRVRVNDIEQDPQGRPPLSQFEQRP